MSLFGGLFGGSNSIFNDPGQIWGGKSSVFNQTFDFVHNLFNPQGPSLQAPPAPPNPSAVAGASLQTELNQEKQQYSASTLLNGGAGLPGGPAPATGIQASGIMRAGSRGI